MANGFIVKTASLLGIRESRRIEGDYIFTLQDWLERKSFDDEIGRNCYFVDVHIPATRPSTTAGANRTALPYRILTPKGMKKPAHRGSLHFGRRRGLGQPACHASIDGNGRGCRYGCGSGHQTVEKRRAQNRCRFPAQTVARGGTIFQIIPPRKQHLPAPKANP